MVEEARSFGFSEAGSMTSGLSHSDISNTVSPTINAASCSDTRTERDEKTEVAAESKEKKDEERERAQDGSAAPATSSEDGLECNTPVPAPPERTSQGGQKGPTAQRSWNAK